MHSRNYVANHVSISYKGLSQLSVVMYEIGV